MKYLSILFITIITLASCSCCSKDNDESRTETTEKAALVAFEKFGKEITAENAIASQDLIAKLAIEDSLYVKVKSTVSAVCKKKGCWMMMPLNEENEMRVKFKDYDFFVPLNCEGKNVVVEGWAFKDVTSVATLKHYALDGGASIAEIDAITEPETGYSFMAEGVLMN